jgi:hypothetical protein
LAIFPEVGDFKNSFVRSQDFSFDDLELHYFLRIKAILNKLNGFPGYSNQQSWKFKPNEGRRAINY